MTDPGQARIKLRSRDGLAMLSLLGLVVLVLWRLALTNLIIGRGDLFFYFYPYRDFASAAARVGRVPLWNPYLFMGAPFLANSQAGFFYPLNLALAWLPVERLVNVSILLHAALALGGAFLWGRGGLGLTRAGAWLTGLCYGLGGYFLAQVEHLNQVQVLAWLPWLLWMYAPLAAQPASPLASQALRLAGLGLITALQFFAGHTQAVFISLVGWVTFALLPPAWERVRRRHVGRGLLRPLGVIVGAVILGAGLAAVQLLPTWELSRLSMRSGGLPYREAVSFSLRPTLLGRALLPAWGEPPFPEFVAYVGVAGLGLATVGGMKVWFGGMRGDKAVRLARRGALLLAILGLFLALGGFNPVYALLVKGVPGFGLFRAPARWLALYALGVAGLVGIGLEDLLAPATAQVQRRARRWPWGWFVILVLLAALVLLGERWGDQLGLGEQNRADLTPPLSVASPLVWVAAALVVGLLLYLGAGRRSQRGRRLLVGGWAVLVALELVGASTFLPLNRATAPGALTSLRPSVAYLSAEAETATTGPAARFLSISDVFFDPGDKPEIEIALGSQLSAKALYDYLIATKQKEVLIPNLPLYYRLPAMDGYDGGVLPLRRYVTLERLYIPGEQVAIDGRLREHLRAVPDGRWLSLFNVRFVVTDKVGDAWFDDVFYDLQMGADLDPGDEVKVGYLPAFDATALGVVYRSEDIPGDEPLAEVEVVFSDGRRTVLPLQGVAPAETGDRVARLRWGRVAQPTQIQVRRVDAAGELMIRGVSLIDERTGAFQSLVLSDRGRYRRVYSGDVKIYENLDPLPRLFFASQAVGASDDEAALAAMRDPGFDPATTVVLAEEASSEGEFHSSENVDAGETDVEILLYQPERVVARVQAPSDGWLVLTDAWYPGWQARVDGRRVPIRRADILFRAVAVPAGEHRVEWIYRPAAFRWGAVVSLLALASLLAIAAWWGVTRRSARLS